MKKSLCLSWILALCIAAGCAQEKPAASPPASDAEQTEPATEETDEDSGEPASSSAAEAPEEAAAGPDPRDVLLRDEAAFVLNYQASDEGKAKVDACDKQAGGDPEKRAKCLSTLMKRVTREGFLFEKDAEGVLHYVRFGIEGGNKVVYNHVLCELGKPDGNKVVVKTSGKDQAKRRQGQVPAEIELEVVDEFTVVANHSDKGRVVYDTRLGFFNEQ